VAELISTLPVTLAEEVKKLRIGGAVVPAILPKIVGLAEPEVSITKVKVVSNSTVLSPVSEQISKPAEALI
jgi:hypothetical protein